MGHSSIRVTVDTYGHLIPGADVKWIDRLDSRSGEQPPETPAQPREGVQPEVPAELVDFIVFPEDSNPRPRDYESSLVFHDPWVTSGS
jgi:hypothetical protein